MNKKGYEKPVAMKAKNKKFNVGNVNQERRFFFFFKERKLLKKKNLSSNTM